MEHYRCQFDFQNAAFISFGGSVATKQIDTVINSFPNARFFSGFDNDYNENMYDIMIEKRLNPKFDIDFKREDNQIVAVHKGVEHRFEKDAISLKTVVATTNLKPLLYVTKPKSGQKDYNDMLRSLTDNVKQLEKNRSKSNEIKTNSRKYKK